MSLPPPLPPHPNLSSSHRPSQSTTNARPPVPPLPPNYRPDSRTHPLFAPMPERIMPSLPADVCVIHIKARQFLTYRYFNLTSIFFRLCFFFKKKKLFFLIHFRLLAHSTTLLWRRLLKCPTLTPSNSTHIHLIPLILKLAAVHHMPP